MNSNLQRALTVLVAVFGLFCLLNLASYFVLSSGHGIQKINDGIVRFGFPFVILEQGGIEGRNRFYQDKALWDLAISLGCAFAVSAFWWSMQTKASELNDQAK